MRFITVIFAFLTLIVVSCSNEEEELPIIEPREVRDIGVLSTSEYTIGKVIIVNDSNIPWYKLGERKIVMSCRAKVKGGIDLKAIEDGDVKVDGKKITIIIPPAKITSFSMDPSDIQTEMEDITGFRDKFSQSDKNNFLRQGETSIRKELTKTSILEDAEENAISFLVDFYEQQGFEQVIIQTSKDK